MIKRAYIEITNTCNLECGFCAKNKRAPKMMSYDSFCYCLDQLEGITSYIYLHVQGEPLTHPLLDKFLKETDKRGFQVQLVTNGTYLNKNMDLLTHSSLRKISFSLHSADYQSVSIVDYLNTILSFCTAASKQGHPYCELRFWTSDRILPNTQYCLDTLKRKYTFKPTKKNDSFEIMPNVFVDYDHKFEWPTPKSVHSNNEGTCHGACDMIGILSNGNVVPCCLDKDGEICFGNIFVTPLNTILSSGRYRYMVNDFKNYKVRESFCQGCTFRNRFNKK